MAAEYTIPLTTDQLKDLLAKVTPGDWMADSLKSTGLPSAYINATDGYPVARAVGVVSEFETEANAALIAIAPTLAAEVVRLREALTRLGTAACFGDGETLGMSLLKDPLGREILSRMEFARQTIDANHSHNCQ